MMVAIFLSGWVAAVPYPVWPHGVWQVLCIRIDFFAFAHLYYSID